MAWSAFAGQMVQYGKDTDLDPIVRDDTTLAPFREAAERIKAEAGYVDAGLATGSIHGSRSADVFKQAMGTCSWHGEWTPETVRELAEKADWSFEVSAELLPFKLSAQAFVEICVSKGYGIGF